MALISVERCFPIKISLNQNEHHEAADNLSKTVYGDSTSHKSSELYIVVRGADIIFPYNECHRFSKTSHKIVLNDIQKHLQSILKLLRPCDTMKMAVRLESQISTNRSRYLLVITNGTDESCLIGADYQDEATIGLVLPIWNDIQITLDGDGGFRITSGIRHHIFKPVSVQAMWSAFQALHLANKKSRKNNYYVNGGSHKWVSYYQARIKSNGSCLHEWHAIVDLHEANCNSIYQIENKPEDQINFEELITTELKRIMISVDLEQITSKEIRNTLEQVFERDLSEFKSYIDKEMIRIMGQLEEPSKILDYLYLGSEWNASNFEELKHKGVKKILNVTCEIENFFPGLFDYYNIRVHDEEGTDMLRYLNDTYCYIRKAKDEGVKVLVHCKKGVSRSASVVVAYLMKERNCHLDEALAFVRNQRSVVRPNPEFLKQLEIYQGMLNASNKNQNIWKSNSESSLKDICSKKSKSEKCDNTLSNRHKLVKTSYDDSVFDKYPYGSKRRSSWSSSKASDNSEFSTLFKNKENYYSNYELNNIITNAEDSAGGDCKKTSKVKEKIEGFENNVFPNLSIKSSKKTVSKNGIVSNLTIQFESKEKRPISNVLNPPTKQLKINVLNNTSNDPQKLSSNILSDAATSVNDSRSTLSNFVDKLLGVVEKPLLKSLSLLSIASTQSQVFANRLAKSLPNLNNCADCTSSKRDNRFVDRKDDSAKYKKFPLDLHCFKSLINDEKNGYVKRRTEELENKKSECLLHQQLSCCVCDNKLGLFSKKSNNFLLRNTFNDSLDRDMGTLVNHADGLSRSTSNPVPNNNYTLSNEQTMNNVTESHVTRSFKNTKKTYGRSHPLDLLKRTQQSSKH